MARLDILKTYKLFVNGSFPRSESGRSIPLIARDGTTIGHGCKASRKDLRDVVLAARAGLAKWSGSTPYLRAQILYRMAEMLQAKRPELAELLAQDPHKSADEKHADLDPNQEVNLAVDRLVYFSGWADKIAHTLGNQNPVNGPYWNISTPVPTGVTVVLAPSAPCLLGAVSLLAPVLASGSSVIVISDAWCPVISTLGEVMATSDAPAGSINILSGSIAELLPFVAGHRDIDAVVACTGPAALSAEQATVLRQGIAENLKRVTTVPAINWSDPASWHTPMLIERTTEIKTVWHPVSM